MLPAPGMLEGRAPVSAFRSGDTIHLNVTASERAPYHPQHDQSGKCLVVVAPCRLRQPRTSHLHELRRWTKNQEDLHWRAIVETEHLSFRTKLGIAFDQSAAQKHTSVCRL